MKDNVDKFQTFVDVELCDVDSQVDVVDLLLQDEGDPSDETSG